MQEEKHKIHPAPDGGMSRLPPPEGQRRQGGDKGCNGGVYAVGGSHEQSEAQRTLRRAATQKGAQGVKHVGQNLFAENFADIALPRHKNTAEREHCFAISCRMLVVFAEDALLLRDLRPDCRRRRKHVKPCAALHHPAQQTAQHPAQKIAEKRNGHRHARLYALYLRKYTPAT